VAKKKKQSRKEKQRIAILKAKYEASLAKQHCKGWGFMEGTCPGTKQCSCCFEVTEGPEKCIGCEGEFSDLKEREKRECPHLIANRKPKEDEEFVKTIPPPPLSSANTFLFKRYPGRPE